MNGYEAQIVEAHTLPGGLCTSWKRKGYLIDGSCHWVTGSGPCSSFYKVWRELGALQGRRYVDYESYTTFTGADGRAFHLYTDIDRLERHLNELSPADAEPARELMDSGTLMNPMLQVTFGVNMDLSGGPAVMSEGFKLPAPVDIGGRKTEWFNVKNYSFDPATAPAGKTVLVSMFIADWPYWEKLKGDPAAYTAEKERTAKVCVDALETRYPGIKSRIEMTDVATPLTYERYTGNWKGVYMTYVLSGDFQRKHRFVPKTVPGLDGFYIASMWTNPPGGLPGAAAVGRTVVQLLCARDKKRFTTAEAEG